MCCWYGCFSHRSDHRWLRPLSAVVVRHGLATSSSSGPITTAHGPSFTAPPPPNSPQSPSLFPFAWFLHLGGRVLRQGVVLSEHDSSHVLYILRYLYILQLFLPLAPCVRLVMLLQHILYKAITAQETNPFKHQAHRGFQTPSRLPNH